MKTEHYQALQELYAHYARVLDQNRLEEWPELFIEEGEYKLQSRENHDAGFPLATIWCESKAMMLDRVFGVRETLYHESYFQHHMVSVPQILKLDGDVIHSEANYLVHRTRRGMMPEVLNLGRYIDEVVMTAEGLRFKRRHCVFDNELIPNSIIYPV